MNKVTRTLRFLNRQSNIPRSCNEIFANQQNAIDAITDDEYYRGYDAILSNHNMTRDEYHKIIHDPALHSFYSPGLPDKYVEVNREIQKYCRSKGIFIITYTLNMFFSETQHAVKRGQIIRHGKKGNYTYTLPNDET